MGRKSNGGGARFDTFKLTPVSRTTTTTSGAGRNGDLDALARSAPTDIEMLNFNGPLANPKTLPSQFVKGYREKKRKLAQKIYRNIKDDIILNEDGSVSYVRPYLQASCLTRARFLYLSLSRVVN